MIPAIGSIPIIQSVPKVAKGDQVVLVVHGGIHGHYHLPAKVVEVRQNGKIDLVAEDLPSHLHHIGTTKEQRIRGRIDSRDGRTVIGGTVFEESTEPRIILTDAPFDPTGRQSDSWHVSTKPNMPVAADPATAGNGNAAAGVAAAESDAADKSKAK